MLIFHARRALRAWLRYRGAQVVVCPENREVVAVAIDTRHAAWSSPQGRPELRLEDCSRWPEKAGCGQDCLSQIELAPEVCSVRTMIANWYKTEPCAFCGREFAEIHWHDNKPALLAPDGSLVKWMAFEPERIMDVIGTHRAVCWDCHQAESFRREHPELVTDRPPRPGIPGA